ncbi:methyltransferase domain-containing protein [Candidatus Desantisbacteria bacterium]|nr:methyltransferase domain-containing protein [Candidatus Desantisbacteria bacterium]
MRLYREQAHNRRIAEKAEIVWGESTLAGRQRIKRRSDLIINGCGIAPGMRVLEIGCGTGLYSRMFAQTKAQIFATDISWELMTHAAKEGEKNDGQNGQNILCQAEKLPFKDMSFDAVVGNAVLHHLDLPLALQEIKRVLIHKGRFAFTEPNMLNPQNILIKNIKFIGRLVGESPDETAFFSWRILRQLKDAGFCKPAAIPFDFLHPVVPDRLVGVVSLLGSLLERLPIVNNMAGSLLVTGSRRSVSLRMWLI